MGACGSVPKMLELELDPEERPLSDYERPNFRSNFSDDYELDADRKLGRGAFGVVCRAEEKATGKQWAVKLLMHSSMSARDKDEVYREILIMRMLGRALNTVHLHAVYRDANFYYLVEELCEGGTVLERLAKKHEANGFLDECLVADVMRQIVRFIAHCHAHRVVYRDIKPSQFMYQGPEEDSPIKGTDFGLSVYLPKNSLPLRRMVGSPAFMAPEVLQERYGLEADMWSCGVACFQLLTGEMPFSARKFLGSEHAGKAKHHLDNSGRNQMLFKDIERGIVDFKAPVWNSYSQGAADFVGALLVRDPAKRLTAEAALRHPWLDPEMSLAEGRRMSKGPARDTVIARLQRFSSLTHFKQLVMSGIARKLESQLPEEQRRRQDEYMRHVHELYEQLDVGKSGLLTAKELSAGLRGAGYDVSVEEMDNLVEALDFHGAGGLDVEEFQAALMDWRTLTEVVPKEKWDKAALEEFKGYSAGHHRISVDEIEGALPRTIDADSRRDDTQETLIHAGVAVDGVLTEKQFLEFVAPQVEPLLSYEPRRKGSTGTGQTTPETQSAGEGREGRDAEPVPV